MQKGLCRCGCGEKTPLAYRNIRRLGWVKGEPIRYIKGHSRRKSGIAYVEEDRGYVTPCWIWQRGTSGEYGMAYDSIQKRERGAHVLEWEKVNGPVPDGMELDHLCRVRPCVNPDHLEPVTRATNVRRGRLTIITPDQVEDIRQRWTAAERKWGLQTALAKEFGVTSGCIHLIVHGKNHRPV